MQPNIAIEDILEIASNAGQAIMHVYQRPDLFSEITIKSDHSPLTLADKASNEIIVPSLTKLYPNIPIISEESKQIDYLVRENWESFWLVDPLDGTKEFIKRNGEFTVNIALIYKKQPVLGVIQVPINNVIYYAFENKSYKEENGYTKTIRVNHKSDNYVGIGSRSHPGTLEAEFLLKYHVSEMISAGSSLKFCYIAEGKADIYYREGPTMEWDTAAGQAIVLGAGGKVEGISYNKPNMLNSSFYCLGF
ncbi:MAG: 3'(2'),5'-bisphosphate nucleotidase CysQ [Bacteroidota bacterium]|nr:3'(2'),5'-bisphosphate nucleotidase CysQ [Bacteroidota bacterium]